jgi:hypothetical protein
MNIVLRYTALCEDYQVIPPEFTNAPFPPTMTCLAHTAAAINNSILLVTLSRTLPPSVAAVVPTLLFNQAIAILRRPALVLH